jgi:medium-chain acyl-[acyl-carrier-protein] hydrolase
MSNDPWLMRLRQASNGGRLRLFCFPYAGGGAAVLRTWFDELPKEIDVYAIQLPGRERRLAERPYTQMQNLIRVLAENLRPYLIPPFAFFGHSMGALIAFELARYLRRESAIGPAHLFVSGHRAPHLPSMFRPIHHLSDQDFIDELRRLNGTPEEIFQSPEMLQLVLPALRADFTMCETYTFSDTGALECPISALGGLDDDRASSDELRAWEQQTRGNFMLHMIQGDHFFPWSAKPVLLNTICNDLKPFWERAPLRYRNVAEQPPIASPVGRIGPIQA